LIFARTTYCLLLLSLFISCNKSEVRKPLNAGVIFTVDIPPDSWYYLKDYLKKNNVKLTFYIEKYHQLTDSSKQIMREMEANGHEIAHHTLTHPHADVYIKKYGINNYIENEIHAMTKMMNNDGFYPKNFAYPFGHLTNELDNKLLEYVNSVRKVVSPYGNKKIADMDLLFYKFDGITLFYGTNIDKRNNNTLEDILQALKVAKNRKEALSIYCHYVSKHPLANVDNSYILEDDFFKIIELANTLNLKFYTVSELSRKKY